MNLVSVIPSVPPLRPEELNSPHDNVSGSGKCGTSLKNHRGVDWQESWVHGTNDLSCLNCVVLVGMVPSVDHTPALETCLVSVGTVQLWEPTVEPENQLQKVVL